MEYYHKDGQVYNEEHRLLGSKDKQGYIKFATCSGNRSSTKQWLAHRWIWTQVNGEIPKVYDVDHIDFNPSNNKIENLQLVTRKQHRDRRNQKGTVYQRSSGRYQAQRNNKHIGMYATKCAAIMACNLYYI